MKSVIKKLGFKNITVNKQTSFMTVMSIALSVAMTTMVVSLMFGVFKEMETRILEESPQYNVYIVGVTDSKGFVEELGDSVEDAYTISYNWRIGTEFKTSTDVIATDYISRYSMYSDSERTEFPTPESYLDRGRLSNNENEVVINYYSSTMHQLDVGDSVTLVSYDDDPQNYGEIPKSNLEKEVTVVGVFKEGTNERAYIQSSETGQNTELFIKFKPGIKNIDKLIDKIDIEKYRDTDDGDRNHYISYNGEYNTLKGMQVELSQNKMTLGVASAIFVLILSLATFSLIFNAFNSNVEKQIHNYGMLRSVGATKKQLKSIIRIEGYTLTIVGLVLGIAIGFGIGSGIAWFVNQQIHIAQTAFNFRFEYTVRAALPLNGILVVTALSLVIVSIPLNLSISRLFKLTSVESLRESRRYKKKRKAKVAPLNKNVTTGLARRFTRFDKSRFTGIKTSLSISIVIFISLMSFIKIGFGVANTYELSDHNVEVSIHDYSNYESPNVTEEIQKVENALKEVEASVDSYQKNIWFTIILFDDKGEELKMVDVLDQTYFHADSPNRNDLVLVDDDVFNEIVTENGGTLGTIDSILINTYKGVVYDGTSKPEYVHDGDVYILEDHQKVQLGMYSYDEELEQEVYLFGQEYTIDMTIDKLPESIRPMIYYQDAPTAYLILPMSELNSIDMMFNGHDGPTNKSGFVGARFNVYAKDSFAVEKHMIDEYINVTNIEAQQAQIALIRSTIERIITGILIFIGTVCVLNMASITLSNNNLRRKDFAGLKSVGMTQRSLSMMLLKEAVFIILVPIVVGTTLGVLSSYVFTTVINNFTREANFVFTMDYRAIVISWLLAVVIIVVNSSITIHESKKYSIVDDLRRVS